MKSWLPPTSKRCWNLDSLPSQRSADFKPSDEDSNHRRKPWKSDWNSFSLSSLALKNVLITWDHPPTCGVENKTHLKTPASMGMSSSLVNFQGCMIQQNLHGSCEKVRAGFEWKWGTPNPPVYRQFPYEHCQFGDILFLHTHTHIYNIYIYIYVCVYIYISNRWLYFHHG